MEKKSGEGSSSTNGVTDPMQRLASFRSPRDLTLGGVKVNKKVFAPNLNVSRNKSKGPELKTSDRKEGKHHKDHKRDNHRKNGPNIIQSSGIFSEGMAAADRRAGSIGFGGGRGGFGGGGGGGGGGSGRGGGGGGGDAAVLQKPIIRPNDVIKVDKQLEDECIRRAMGEGAEVTYDDSKDSTRHDLPVKLPIADFRRLNVRSKRKMTNMSVVKTEPGSESDVVDEDVKPLIDVKSDLFEEKDIVTLLQSNHPTLILMQLPESMPGRGDGEDDAGTNDEHTEARKCRLTSLAEGRVGQLRVHRSGRVRLCIGDTHFEVTVYEVLVRGGTKKVISGTKAMHYQEVVSVASNPASRSARITAIGALHHKVTVVPDWETLLQPTT